MRNSCIKILDFPSHKRCDKTTHLTPILFYDPLHQTTETVYNCQFHSDDILRKLIGIGSDYQNIQNLIEIATGRKKDGTIYGNELNFQKDVKVESELEKLYDLRSTITNKICRLPNCERHQNFLYKKKMRGKTYEFYGSPLDDQVFTVFPFGTNGKNRHKLYFHEECANTLKRMFGEMPFKKPETHPLTIFVK